MRTCIVTCTGGRPEFFRLCKMWVGRQTLQPDVWLVGTDVDGEIGELPPFARHVELPAAAKDSKELRSSMALRSLSRLLQHVPEDHHVVVFEDDDWYAPNYVETLEMALWNCSLTAPEAEIRYNIVSRRWQRFSGDKDANAGSTAIHADVVRHYADIVAIGHGQDNVAWKTLTSRRTTGTKRVAMKGAGFGLPGRMGATRKHSPWETVEKGWKHDPHLLMFREFVGDNFKHYQETFPCMTT